MEGSKENGGTERGGNKVIRKGGGGRRKLKGRKGMDIICSLTSMDTHALQYSLTAARNQLWVLTGHQQEPMRQQQ